MNEPLKIIKAKYGPIPNDAPEILLILNYLEDGTINTLQKLRERFLIRYPNEDTNMRIKNLEWAFQRNEELPAFEFEDKKNYTIQKYSNYKISLSNDGKKVLVLLKNKNYTLEEAMIEAGVIIVVDYSNENKIINNQEDKVSSASVVNLIVWGLFILLIVLASMLGSF
jgi:hypothetical protein